MTGMTNDLLIIDKVLTAYEDCVMNMYMEDKMEFDKSRAYTAVNADELKPGDKVIVADSLLTLQASVKNNEVTELLEVSNNNGTLYRFKAYSTMFALAYLVERAAEKKWRAYKDCDEMIKDFIKCDECGNVRVYGELWHPSIWVKEKSTNNIFMSIAYIHNDCVCLGAMDYSISLTELFEKYTYIDGTPCGMKE